MDPTQRNTLALAGLRIAVGVLFLIFGEYKVFGTEFTLHGGFERWIRLFADHGAYPFMVGVLRDFVLPHARFLAFLVAYGEFSIGLALTLGILVRTASLFRADLYALAAVLVKLSGAERGLLAILRRVAQPFGTGALFRYPRNIRFGAHPLALAVLEAHVRSNRPPYQVVARRPLCVVSRSMNWGWAWFLTHTSSGLRSKARH